MMRFLAFAVITALAAGPAAGSVTLRERGQTDGGDSSLQGRDAPNVDLQKRIASGRDASAGEFKQVCSLQRRSLLFFWRHTCGAVIVNNRTILTAASCVDGRLRRTLRVQCGQLNLDETEDTTQRRQIDTITIFPNFTEGDNGSFENDLALLELSEPLEFNDNIQPAVIDDGSRFILRSRCQVAGWGRLATGVRTDILQEVTINRISNFRCQLRWGDLITENHVCFKDLLSIDSPCEGDYGGPAICGNVVMGLASWGMCGSRTFPSVFTRLSGFSNWIGENTF